MSKVRYRLHPGEYELGENERFYSDMEVKGWRLVKRGRYLSKFVSLEPRQTRYRIEVSASSFLEEPGLSDGQLAVFEDCGWEHVTSRGFLHIFRAPEGSDAPEFYSEPAQQAATLRKIRRDLWKGWAVIIIAVALAACMIALSGRPWSKVAGEVFQRFVQIPALYTAYWSWLLWLIYRMARDTWIVGRTYRRLKKGVPLDHAPQKRRLAYRLVSAVLLGLSLLSVMLLAVQLAAIRSGPLPVEPDGPYITLSDMGWEGRRGTLFGRESDITHVRSLLADYWETLEVIDCSNGDNVWMRQHVYRLRFPSMAGPLAQSLMATPVLAYGPEAFSPVAGTGLDGAWATNGFELVAVHGDLVTYVEILGPKYDDFDPQPICAALQAAWDVPAP